ncbi:MAG: hypothetical protein JXR15_03985 [Shimia sp.]|uniref:type II secretion system protein GspL n=1 Tax=Shimia sp. TaxID=1954381 RepID=UPI003B8B1F25
MLTLAKKTNAVAAKTEPARFVRFGDSTLASGHVVLVPGHLVPQIDLDLPKSLRGQAREQVARRQLADRMGIGTAEDMRPCALGDADDGWSRVFVCDQAQMATWRDLECQAVLPDYLSLPTTKGLWTLGQSEADGAALVMARFGPEEGLSALPEVLEALMSKELATGPRPKAILWQGAPVGTLSMLAQSYDVPVVTDVQSLAELGVETPKILSHGELNCDLRKDPMAARTRLARRVLPWRWTGLAAALAVILWSASQLVAINRIEAQTTDLTSQTQAQVRAEFVPNGPILDVRSQVSRTLSELRQARAGVSEQLDVLDMTADVGAVLDAAKAVPELVSYAKEDGLLLVVRLPDFASAERLTAALQTDAMEAELEESRVSDGQAGVRTEIRVTPREVSQ